MAYLPAQTLAILSYLDPVTAVLLSALVLHEPLSGFEIFGAVCILRRSGGQRTAGPREKDVNFLRIRFSLFLSPKNSV